LRKRFVATIDAFVKGVTCDALILMSRFSGASKDGPRAAWFETALKRLLTMRVK
jgi:hypothetical protein